MSELTNDKSYWENFYNNSVNIDSPSPFASFLMDEIFPKNINVLVELGCGNGRDAKYFAENGIQVIAIDQCENTTNKLNQIDNIDSFSHDFTRLPSFSEKNYQIDVVYSRFTMHSINLQAEERTIKWVFNNLKLGGIFCIEARTIKDSLCGKGINKGNNIWFYNSHHRRFIDANNFKEKLKKNGFKIVYFEEKNGFAKYKNEDPIVLRAIVKKV